MQRPRQITLAISVLLGMVLAAVPARADVVTDWNVKANELVVEAKLGTPPAMRIMAIVHTAVYEAANAVTKRYPAGALKLDAAPGASLDAAVAAANRVTLLKLLPSVQPAIDSAYQAALAKVADGPAKTAGIAVGEQAAAAVLAGAVEDRANAAEAYRPHTTPGAYVPTVVPAVPQWAQRKPWVLSSPAQFRPGPPPPLNSELWARDYNEIKAIGSRNSSQPQRRADRDRALLGLLVAADLPQRRALGGQPARPRARHRTRGCSWPRRRPATTRSSPSWRPSTTTTSGDR